MSAAATADGVTGLPPGVGGTATTVVSEQKACKAHPLSTRQRAAAVAAAGGRAEAAAPGPATPILGAPPCFRQPPRRSVSRAPPPPGIKTVSKLGRSRTNAACTKANTRGRTTTTIARLHCE